MLVLDLSSPLEDEDDRELQDLFAQGLAFLEDAVFSDRALTEPLWRSKILEALKQFSDCKRCGDPIAWLEFNGRKVAVEADSTELGDIDYDMKRHERHMCQGGSNE